MTENSDAMLLTQWAVQRDADAFMELVIRHSSMVYATCLRVMGNHADAEEVTQECFLELVRSARRIHKTPAGWLHAVAVRQSALRARSEMRRRVREQAYAERRGAAEEPGWDAVREELDACMTELPEALRAAVVLRFLEGLTHEETGRRLGVPASTAQYRIQKGLETLRELLRKRGITSSAAGLSALMLANMARAVEIPPGLLVSLGRLALAEGVTAPVVTGFSLGGLLAMKYVRAAVIAVVAAVAVGIGATRYMQSADKPVQTADTPQADTAAVASPAAKPPPAIATTAPAQGGKTAVKTAVDETPNVTGTAVHTDTGQPMPDLVFSLRKYVGNPPYGGYQNIGNVKTDAQGHFAISASDVTRYWFILEHESLALYEPGGFQIKEPGQIIDDLVLEIGPGASVSGRVYDVSTGRGIPGVKVITYGGRRAAETDAEGRYLLAGLTPNCGPLNLGDTGPYVNLNALGMGGHYVEMKLGRHIEVDFPLERGIELRGLVVNESGEPMTAGNVMLQGDEMINSAHKILMVRTEIGADGRFVLQGVKPNFQYRSLSVAGRRSDPGADKLGYWPYQQYEDVRPWSGERRFVLQRGAQVCGKVTDATTGRPIPAFELLWVPMQVEHFEGGWRENFTAVQDPDGAFCWRAGRGANTLFTRAEGYTLNVTHFETSEPGQRVDIEVALEPGAVVEGTVRDFKGEIVPGAWIFDGVPPEGDPYTRQLAALTNADMTGHFRAAIEPGEHVISAWSDGLGATQATITVEEGDTVNVELKLGEGARITGRITESGRAVQARVSFSAQAENPMPEGDWTSADDEGRYVLSGLSAGSGVLSIELGTYPGARRLKKIAVDVLEGKETVIDYDFPAISTTITGAVTVDGAPLQTGILAAFVKGEPGPLDTVTGRIAEGVYSITTDLEGPITLCVSYRSESGERMHREIVNAAAGETIRHDIYIASASGVLEGQIVPPPSGSELRIMGVGLIEGTLEADAVQQSDYYVTTALVATSAPDDAGRYSFENVADGDYTVVLLATTKTNEPYYVFGHASVRNGATVTVNLEIR